MNKNYNISKQDILVYKIFLGIQFLTVKYKIKKIKIVVQKLADIIAFIQDSSLYLLVK